MRRPGLLALALLLLTTAVAPVWAKSTPSRRRSPARAARARAGPATVSFGSWGHGAWSWFGDPRAVYVDGQYGEVFVGWIDWSGNVTIGAYDPQFGVTSGHVIGHLFHDDHSAPSIFVEPDQRLTVFWSGHNGSEMYYRSTLRPEDISAWGPLQHLSGNVNGSLGFTYPNPVLLSAEDNTLYLFWRGANWSADYATRTVTGRWSHPHEMIRVPGQRPYVKVASNGSDEIVVAFTNGHPRNVLTSIYYAAYRSGSLWTAGGRWIARMGSGPIAPRQAQVVYNAQPTHIRAWPWDVALEANGDPVIVYATFPTNQRHEYWYADWTGKRWISHFLTDGGGTIAPGTIEFEYSGGITLDHSDPSIVYLSRQVAGGWDIERWMTTDGGVHWRHTVVVPADGTDNVRPVVPRGHDHGPMSLLWLHGHYGDYTSYRTSVDYVR
jgi:BNR repeat-containing family member